MGRLRLMTVFAMMLCVTLSCVQKQQSGDLVQPDTWWSVHPRPIYAQLEKVGTYQGWFDVYKLCDGTYAIYEPNQFEEAISYLVEGSDRAIILDTGTGIGNLRDVTEELTDLPVSVVLTHEHYDHVAAAYRWDEIVMFDNADAIAVLKAGRDNASLQKYLVDDYLWKPLPKDFDPADWEIPSMTPTGVVRDGDVIDLGGRQLEVIYTPGHSPGQMCLLDKANRILFTGDHFFPGPLYAHAPDVDIDAYVASNKKLTRRIDEFDHLCSGHNDPWVKSEVLIRVDKAFKTIFSGGGTYVEDSGLRRYQFNGFDVLIRTDQIPQSAH